MASIPWPFSRIEFDLDFQLASAHLGCGDSWFMDSDVNLKESQNMLQQNPDPNIIQFYIQRDLSNPLAVLG